MLACFVESHAGPSDAKSLKILLFWSKGLALNHLMFQSNDFGETWLPNHAGHHSHPASLVGLSLSCWNSANWYTWIESDPVDWFAPVEQELTPVALKAGCWWNLVAQILLGLRHEFVVLTVRTFHFSKMAWLKSPLEQGNSLWFSQYHLSRPIRMTSNGFSAYRRRDMDAKMM